MKNKYIRLKALLLAGTMFLSSSILTSCKEDTSNQTVISEEITTNFDIGEHIISIPITCLNCKVLPMGIINGGFRGCIRIPLLPTDSSVAPLKFRPKSSARPYREERAAVHGEKCQICKIMWFNIVWIIIRQL